MRSAHAGFSIELYYIDGRPDGLATAKMSNWSGQLLVVPRTQLADALSRSELSAAGVYLLLGEQDGNPLAYIGESETVSTRIRQHDVHKDWWTQAILVTAAANELNKAHVRYLESRLIQSAQKVGRIPLINGTAPPLPSLSESDRGKMEVFLDNMLMVLPAVRVDLFVERARPAVTKVDASGATVSVTESPRFVLAQKRQGLTATAILMDGEFIVETGSQARGAWEGAQGVGFQSLYDELRRAGVLQLQGDHCVFTQNYAFKSTSAAAGVVTGRSANGTTAWKTQSGRTYKEWEQDSLKGL